MMGRKDLSNALLPLVGVAILLAVWALVNGLKLVDPVLLPSPAATFRTLWHSTIRIVFR